MHILTPVDGSEPSRRAVELAAKFAIGLNSKLTILAVRQYIVGRKLTADVQTQEEIDQLLRSLKATAMSFGAIDAVTVKVNSRDTAHAIVDFAEKNDIDMIVMGATGLGKLKSFVIGSVSAEVVRKSACPVTIVH